MVKQIVNYEELFTLTFLKYTVISQNYVISLYLTNKKIKVQIY